jgi:L-fuconolactonase
VPWPPKDDALLYRPVLPTDFRRLALPEGVTGTIVVEASPWLEDNQWILDLAADEPIIQGFVGCLPPGREGFAAHLERFSRDPKFRGIRVGTWDRQVRLDDTTVRKDLKELAKRDLALDLNGGPESLPAVAALAKAIPDLPIVINHVANVRIDGRTPPADWATGMREAAQRKNVHCKVSGLVEGTGKVDGQAPRDAGFYRPVLDVVWEAFGEDRLIYGSNWPVSERFAPYATVRQIVVDYFSVKGRNVLARVLRRNAARFYRVKPGP